MKTYEVKIESLIYQVVDIDAETEQEALQSARDNFNDMELRTKGELVSVGEGYGIWSVKEKEKKEEQEMKEYEFTVQVNKTCNVSVEAESEDDARLQVAAMHPDEMFLQDEYFGIDDVELDHIHDE